jgi:hypothetical protein
MKRSRWAFLLLAATAVLFGQRADAMRTPLTDVRAAITQPQQLTAPATDAATPADAWLVESIIPLGHSDDGQPLVLISLLIPTAHLAENTPASTRAGPYAAPKTHTRVFYIGQPPLGLAWTMRTGDDGSVVVYHASGFFNPRPEGAMKFGRYVEGPEYAYLTAQGTVGRSRDRSIVFDQRGSINLAAFHAALRNIPDELTKQMLAANAADRQSMLMNFLATPPENGGAGAKWAAVGDVIVSAIGASTSFNGVNYDASQGGLFQELGGYDSRGSSYQSVARHSHS